MTTHLQVPPPPLSSQSMADLLCTIILLCHGQQSNGKPFWAYLCIKPSMARAFKEARDSGNFNLEDFGTILEWGEGLRVPDHTQRIMERDYAVRHDFESQLDYAIAHIRQQ